MNDLLLQFVAEARDLLQEAGEDLLALERRPDDEAAITRIFRSVHTLKGSSGLFDIPPLTRILHAGEDLFQAVREFGLVLTPQMVDLLLKSLDQVGAWIEDLDRTEALPENAESIAAVLAAELRARLARRTDEPLAAPAALQVAVPEAVAQWFTKTALREAAAAGGTLTVISYVPDEACFFKGEDPLHLALQIPDMRALAVEQASAMPPIGSLDPFSCNLAFHALSGADPAALESLFRYVPEQVTLTRLAAIAAPPPARARPLPDDVAAVLLDEQITMLALDVPAEEFAGRIASATRVACGVLRHGGNDHDIPRIEAAAAEALDTGHCSPLSAAIARLVADQAPPPTEAPLVAPPGGPERPPAEPTTDRVLSRTIRVDQEKVDALMNLVGELVVAKNSLPFLARRAEHAFGLRELGREIKDQYSVIDRIAQELQSSVMAIRMMPVGQVFQRFPRLVRDIARKLGKQVDLVIEGEETEADKNVIETLFDPLLHMVRNSLDHGIEMPAERAACGKPATATVRLQARHDSDQVVIEIEDDGRGIDPDVVKRRAYERGLLSEERLATIDDDAARMLVFAAGFSTAEQVSDLSGRGVGMDIVRNAVERAGGQIALSSTKGSGTTVRLNLPLSMAVSRVMTITLNNRLFGIPMDLIHETVKLPPDRIIHIKTSEAFVLRDRVVPLLRLARLLELPDQTAAEDDVAVLVVRVGAHTVGLGISAFGEGMEVILKPLEGILATIPGYAGTALLGDGRVLLVLDLRELIR
jgi:two-component system chemotaxis sensor kinase CheA